MNSALFSRFNFERPTVPDRKLVWRKLKVFHPFRIFSNRRISRLVTMALESNPFLRGHLSFGQFDFFNPGSVLVRRRAFLNRLISVVVFLNAFKLLLIVFSAWLGHLEVKLYMIEMFLFDESRQKYFDIGISIIQIGLFLSLSYWADLDRKTNTLESFSFLLINDGSNNAHQCRQRYLDKESTDKFIRVYRFACRLLQLVTSAYHIFFLGTIPFCLYKSFYAVSRIYFFSAGLLFGLITVMAYLILTLFLPSKYFLAFLSTEFTILRLQAIETLIRGRFVNTASASRPIQLRRDDSDLLKARHLLNDFCRQFKEINSVLDTTISGMVLGVFITLFFIPYFLVFGDNTLLIKIFIALGVTIDYLCCSSFSIYNDRLRRQVGRFWVFSEP